MTSELRVKPLVAYLAYPVGYFAGTLPAIALGQYLSLGNFGILTLMILGAMPGIVAGSIGYHYFSRTWRVKDD